MLLWSNDQTSLVITRNSVDLKEAIIFIVYTPNDLFYIIFHTSVSHWASIKVRRGAISQSRVARKLNYREMPEKNVFSFYNIDWEQVRLEYVRASKNGTGSYRYL